jgi:hypothetical protein
VTDFKHGKGALTYDWMDQAEQPAEKLIQDEREEPDADDQQNRKNRSRNPLFTSRPGDAPKLGNDAPEEILTRESLNRFFLLVHQGVLQKKTWQGGQDSNLQTVGFGDRCATNCATALSFCP